MSYEITGNRHMGAALKKKQAYFNEWKIKARRKIMPGYPIEKPFETREQIDAYLKVDRLVCLLCGKTYKSLCAHLLVHGTNADAYKEKYGLPFGAGLTCTTTKAMNVKHGKRLVEEGIFRPPTPEEHAAMIAKKAKPRPKPAYAIQEGTLRITTGKKADKIYKDDHYWRVLELAEANNSHPTDYCRNSDDSLPSLTMLHKYKAKHPEYKKKYNELVNALPLKIKRKHGKGGNKDFIEKIQQLKNQQKTNAEIASIMGVHEVTIEKYNKKYSLTKPPRTTCGNGLHPYPGYRKPCQPCNTINSRKRLGTMDRNISKNLTINRACSDCNATIEVKRIYGAIKPKYCEGCKKRRYYESQNKYAKEKRGK